MDKVFCALAVLLPLVASCTGRTVSSETRPLPGHWNKDAVVQFEIPQMDSTQPHAIYITLRNTNDYKFNNIYLIASLVHPQGKTQTDTLEYRMAAPDGTWLGQGIGTVKESKLFYKDNIRFTEKGSYRLQIGHANRNNGDPQGVINLEGISDVGYSIETAPQ
ncbi:MAG: gliding motility lipoprotein GldH [Marinirhabdus sp.]